MSQTGRKAEKTKESAIVWTGNEIILFLKVKLEYKMSHTKVSGYSVHTSPETLRTRKFPLWRAYTEISGYTHRIQWTRVDASRIRIKKSSDTRSPDSCRRGLKFLVLETRLSSNSSLTTRRISSSAMLLSQ